MFRTKRKSSSVVGVSNGEAKGEKSRSRSSVSISLNKDESSNVEDELRTRSGPFLEVESTRRSKKEMVTTKLLPDCNQLYPDSVFSSDRRYSFTGYGHQQRRASYDRYQLGDNNIAEFANVERRASYDVSLLKTADTLHVNEDHKSTRRDSLVRR